MLTLVIADVAQLLALLLGDGTVDGLGNTPIDLLGLFTTDGLGLIS